MPGILLYMPDAKPKKDQLRSSLRQHRKSLDPGEQHRAAHALVDSVSDLDTWTNAQNIAIYLANDGEIDTGPLVKRGRALNKQLFLPIITPDDSLEFGAWLPGDTLPLNRYGIGEPSADATRCPATELDIIFLPLVGWDHRGGRLGMGGGFYDRALSGVSDPALVGLAYTHQQVERIPAEQWDVLLHFVATDTALHHCREGG
jgi:5-formyltetrahydrofolate cyclo-ligase